MKVCTIICALIAIVASAMAAPVGTAFTYQGKLTDSSGNPVSGSRDMTFKLFDALTEGNQVGATLTKTGVSVSGGLFTVQLDFGSGAFNGEKRWLETTVGAETMSPRTEVATPPGPLQMQVSDLQNSAYVGGLLSVTTGSECVNTDTEINCGNTTTATLATLQGHALYLEVQAGTGQPMHLEVAKRLRTPAPTAKAFDVRVKVIRPVVGPEISVSPDDPVSSTGQDQWYGSNVRATLVNDSIVKLRFANIVSVGLIEYEACGSIEDAHVEPYRPGAQEAQLKVTICNFGSVESPYVVTVTECGSSVDPLVAQTKTLAPTDAAQFSFTLRTSGSFSSANTCRVRIKTVTGRLLGEWLVTFPAPTAP